MLSHRSVVALSARFLIIFSAFLALSFFFSLPVHAQEGLGIKPAVIEESLDPGAVQQYVIEVENLNPRDQEYFVFTRNISGVGPGGVPIFAQDNLEKTGYELADWIELPYTQVTIPAGQKVSLSITMNVPENASPGSHFGGVFFSVEPPEVDMVGAAIGYQVANIISIRISGDVIEKANIRQFSTDKFIYGAPKVNFNVRIENEGNVLVRPVGPLEIHNMLGNKVGTIIFNEAQAGVFPKSTKEFDEIVWDGGTTGFGRYEAILSPVYGETGAINTMSSTVTFWVLPMNIIGPALIVLAVVLLVTFVFVRLYIKRSLAHMTQGRRIIRQRRRGGPSSLMLFTVVMLTVTALFLIVLLALFA
ncbi:MAG: hypothetical protein KC877_00605 [Candidatus Kaiserbacteria bacterium]|nr:hypothetical protein [Candidatus Kaiserbacteria bacterium]MCB9815931.1 hypothetical protein [Candidatus Nomurabacteria bacterium]